MAQNQSLLTDGSLDWSLGVNSIKTPTIASNLNPTGMARNELPWLDNGTVRGGGISQRPGITRINALPVVGYHQGSIVYVPVGIGEEPYVVTFIAGQMWTYPVDQPDLAINQSAIFGLSHPETERVFYCQAERYLIIQAGDGVTLPLFWDGTTLSRSKGIVDTTATTASPPHTNEIPAATAMCYYMGRVWYAQNRTVSAGDIVGGTAGYPVGNPKYDHFKDSVLCVQENPLCVGGDGFTIPAGTGNIRGITFASTLNTQLGQGGVLYVGTPEQIFQLQVPVTRTDWINAGSSTQPLMTAAVIGAGWVSDRSIVAVNSDLFFQTLEPAIRSLALAIRNFGQWGNVPLSINEYRVVQYNDRSLLRFGSGILFDNRLLQTALPYTCAVGTAHRAILPLNFDVISSLQGQVTASTGVLANYPAWEGMWEGLNVLEIIKGNFGGRDRAIVLVWSETNQKIEVWEIRTDSVYDLQGNRIVWYVEFPAFTFGQELDIKKMVSAELWVDKLWGEAIFKLEWRPDGSPCWIQWHEWTLCTDADPVPEIPYPTQVRKPSYRQTITLPKPPADCSNPMNRPSDQGMQFQCRLTVKGAARIRGFFLHGEPMPRRLYDSMVTC